MRIDSIKLTNFRRFQEAEIYFPEGLIGIIGKNGSGKSTILEGLSWAIYGHNASRTNKELIKRRGSGPNEPVEVELRFNLEGNDYIVKRSMVGQNLTAQAEIRVNGNLILQPGPKSSQECTRFLSSALHMDEHSFHTSLIARQKELDMLSQLRPHERKSLIMRMLRIDVIDDAIELVRRDMRGKKELISQLESLVPDLDKLKDDLRDFEGKKVVAEKEVNGAKSQVEALRASVKEADEARKTLKSSYERYLDLRERASIFSNRVADLKERIIEKEQQLIDLEGKEIEAGKLSSAQDELDRINDELSRLETEREKKSRKERATIDVDGHIREASTIDKEICELEAKCDSLSEVLEAPMDDLDKLNDEILALKFQIQGIEVNIKKGNDELVELAGRRGDIESLGPESTCPTCERKLGSQYPLLMRKYVDKENELRRSCANMERDLHQKSQVLETLIRELRRAKSRGERRRKVEQELSKFRTEIEGKELRSHDTKVMISRLKEEIKDLENDFDLQGYLDLKSHRKLLERNSNLYRELMVEVRQREQLKVGLEDLTTKRDEALLSLKSLRVEILGLGDAKLSYEGALGEFEMRNEELKNGEIKFERLASSLDAIDGEIRRIRDNLEEGKKWRDKINDERGDLRLLSELAGGKSSLLIDFRDDVIARIRPGLSSIGSELLFEITNGKYDELTVDEDYGVWIYEDGESFPIERFSGGERDVANLCLRIAISRLVAERSNLELDFIALDEIFGSQDPGRRESIMSSLNTLLSRFSQVVLITHIEDVRDKIPNPIEVIEKDGTSSIR